MSERNLKIAVPKGSLFADTVELLGKAGLDTTGLEDPGRRLIISNPGVDFIIVRPTDAPVFAAYGGADCGICGKDTLVEAELDVLELVDLKYGYCRFVVAEPEAAAGKADESYERLGVLRVATKYPHITQAYYESIGVQADIVRMHGNIELGPIVGMADRIVDITATGTTLRENHLRVVDEVLGSTARFIANAASVRTDPRVIELAGKLEELTRDNEPTMS
ncbi:MAG: ATP phosphoribosyltransferase [Coriobacteriales bacterium]|jgi:ATP phosphoribosyltransferase